MIRRLQIRRESALPEFGMACQRIIPWPEPRDGRREEPPLGAMACFLPAGRSSDPDRHDQDEVMVILAGQGGVDLAGEREEFRTGDVILLPRRLRHVVHNPGPADLTWLSLYWPLHEPAPGTAPNAGPGVSA